MDQEPNKYTPVNASPVKSFFVSMLTRDIPLEYAILDLLDNCIDGVLRSKKAKAGPQPYAGFVAEIEFDKHSFMIADNCGGIPWSLRDYAFRMGSPGAVAREGSPATVGVYGIGMKRAIFKMGAECVISTQNENDRYEVDIGPSWMDDEADWTIPVRAAQKLRHEDGTTVMVSRLHPGVAAQFGDDGKAFTLDLERMIATHYAFIIEKGFEVRLNKQRVRPRPTRLIFNKAPSGPKAPAIRPFIYKTTTPDGVEVFLAVGFTRPIPSQDEAQSDLEERKYSSLDAGWTVLCNGRAVLYCDRTELTGWGEAGIPRYHNQFIAISGVVEFRANDPSKLPTTTTKRGIDASSPLYLQVKNKMREGMRLFTDYTNQWKGRAEESRKHIEAGQAMSLEEVRSEAERLTFRATARTVTPGSQYKPVLPMPARVEPSAKRISYVRKVADIRCVAEHLFDNEAIDPSVVGEKCFDLILKEARR